MTKPNKPPFSINRIALLIAAIYALFSLVWIFFSDRVLVFLVQDAETLTTIQSFKGACFVILTAILIFLLVRTFVGKAQLLQQQLDESAALYRDFVEETDDLLTQVDELGRFTYVNNSSRAVFGLEPRDCIGLSAFDFIHPEDREETVNRFTKAITRQQQSVEFDNRQVSRCGKMTRMLWMTNIHYRDNGKVESINSIAHDITQRVQMEETLLQTEKMVSIGGMAAGLAHEINNPIAGILQSAQLLRNRLLNESVKNTALAEDTALPLPAFHAYLELQKAPQLLENIRESGERVARIVSDILEFSSRRLVEPVPFDMRDLLEQTLELASKELDLSAHFDFRNIKIVREYFGDLPDICCDRTQIQQVLLNMLRNGAHAMLTWQQMERQPQFTLRLRRVADEMEIQIEDNGSGMDEDTTSHIFEPFYTTKSVGQGTGLGLFVSYFVVVEKHRGALQVESHPGKGTCFTIRLPLQKSTADGAAGEALPRSG